MQINSRTSLERNNGTVSSTEEATHARRVCPAEPWGGGSTCGPVSLVSFLAGGAQTPDSVGAQVNE